METVETSKAKVSPTAPIILECVEEEWPESTSVVLGDAIKVSLERKHPTVIYEEPELITMNALTIIQPPLETALVSQPSRPEGDETLQSPSFEISDAHMVGGGV